MATSNIQFPTSFEQKVVSLYPSYHGLGQEGSTYIATNPTVGTGIAITTSVVDDAATASSTHAQFAPALLVQNTWSASNTAAKSLYPLYIKLITTAIPTSATRWDCSVRLDNVATKYVSGGSTITPVCLNSNVATTSGASVYFGAIVPSGVQTGAGRLVGRALLSSTIPVVLDTYIITFGDVGASTNVANGGATRADKTIPMAACVVAPGWSFQLDLFGASNAAAAGYEFEFVYAER